MGPHPEVSVDVQKYIGSCLISQQPRSKRKPCLRGSDKEVPQSRGGGNYGSSLPVPICNCCGGVQINKVGYPSIHNYAWTGVPLISVAGRHKGHGNGKAPRPGNRARVLDKQADLSAKLPDTIQNSPPNNGSSMEEILPISRLAIHAQGAPLIFSTEDSGNQGKEKTTLNGGPRKDKTLLKGRNIYLGSGIYMVGSQDYPPTASSPSCRDDTASTSGESDIKSEPDLARQTPPSQQSDCISTTSEDSSGMSENGLPRIIKPRKRRKKDRRMSEGDSDQHNSGVIVTLKPYQPLCYSYTDHGGYTSRDQSLPSNESSCDTSLGADTEIATRQAPRYNSEYPYPPSPFCSCRYCAPPSSLFITPPESPVGCPAELFGGNKKERSRSSVCEVSTRIVTTPCGNRDLEIKFLPASSSDDEGSDTEDLAIERNTPEPERQPLVLNTTNPPQRPWISLSSPNTKYGRCIFTVMCYNVLCDKYATRQLYGYCPNWALAWDYRKKGIMDEIRHYAADIISLQEVETEQFYNFFLPELKRDGYDGIFSPKSRAKIMCESEKKHVDGCAIFFRTSKFTLIREHLVEFNQLAMANAEGSDDMLNRVMTKDNIGLAALLRTNQGVFENGLFDDSSQICQTILVCTAHIHWDPEFCDVKLIQTMMLMQELRSIVDDIVSTAYFNKQKLDADSIPMILCGDFNSLPDSGVIDFLTNGHISANHPDFKELGYKDCLRKLSTCERQNGYFHPFKIARAYKDNDMPYTNYTFDFKGVIDYIFYSKQHISVLGLLGPLEPEWMKENRISGCPHPHIPSDHFPLLAQFEISLSTSSQLAFPKGFILRR